MGGVAQASLLDDGGDEADAQAAFVALAAGIRSLQVRTLLCNVYHHSLHGRYGVARDQLLMSHLGDAIRGRDTSCNLV